MLVIVIVWYLAFAGSVPPFIFEGKNSFKFQPGKAMCLYTFESNMAYTITIECVYIAAPLTIIAVCYVKVFRSVSRSNRVFCLGLNPSELRANVEEAKVTKTLVAVLLGLACCWLPISVVDNVDAARGEPAIPRQVYLTYAFLIYLSSAINPFITVSWTDSSGESSKPFCARLLSFGAKMEITTAARTLKVIHKLLSLSSVSAF